MSRAVTMLDRILAALVRRPVVAVVAATIVVAGCGGGSAAVYGGGGAATSSGPSAASGSAGQAFVIAIATDPTLGSYLTGANGKTLYVFHKDAPGRSACSGGCATNWPPFILAAGDSVSGGPGVTGPFATLARDDGTTQVTYDGAPLYYFAGDAKPGDTNGEGVSGVWFVATPSGTSPADNPVASPSTGAGTASGYDSYSRGGSGSGGSATATSSPAPAATERPTVPPTATEHPTATPVPAATARPTPTAGPPATPKPTPTARPTPSPAPTRASASIVDFAFAPGTLTVRVGTVVTWTNTGSAPHTVTADGGGFGSPVLQSGTSFSHAFAAAGTFAYHCSIHSSMTGTVVVTP
jgi:predicted lipoprotein with Yx(FWY)xxD motif/plastocyanin